MNKPQYLYHYTDFNGLKGIIDNQSLWLSNRKCVNDTKEFMHSEELIKGCIEEALRNFMNDRGAKRKPTVSPEEFIKKLMEERDSLWKTLFKNLPKAYLFCFCIHEDKDRDTQENGLLSMWRGYGAEGGYALVFNGENVGEYLNRLDSLYPAGPLFERVTYLKYNDITLPKARFDDYHQLKELLENSLIPLLWELKAKEEMTEQEKKEKYNALLRLIILIKHPGYHEENEYRLCLFHYPPKGPTVKIRKRGSSLISFIEYPLDVLSISIEDFVEEIIIGPQQDIETKREFLEDYLRSQGLTKIKVKTSNIPYLPR